MIKFGKSWGNWRTHGLTPTLASPGGLATNRSDREPRLRRDVSGLFEVRSERHISYYLLLMPAPLTEANVLGDVGYLHLKIQSGDGSMARTRWAR